MTMASVATDPLSVTFRALGDPTRRAILRRLTAGTATVQELAKPFEMSLPAVSKHLKVLEQARLIERKTEAQWRRCSLNPEGFRRAAGFVETYRAFWEQQFDQLEDYFATLEEESNSNPMTTTDKGEVQ